MYSKNKIFIKYGEILYWPYKVQGKDQVDHSKNRIFIEYRENLYWFYKVLRKGSS